jgi:hypothetical protein
VRTSGYSKNTILNWEKRLAALQETLFLYALVHEFIKLVIEGDGHWCSLIKGEKSYGVRFRGNREIIKT